MFEMYGTDLEIFAKCKQCGQIWEISGVEFKKVIAMPIDAVFMPAEMFFKMELPNCCVEE